MINEAEIQEVLYTLGSELSRVYLASIGDFTDELEAFVNRGDLEGAREHVRALTLKPLYDTNRDRIERYNMIAFKFGSQMINQTPQGVRAGIIPSIVSAATEQTGMMLIDLADTIKKRLLGQLERLDESLINAGQKAEVDPNQRILDQFKTKLKNTARGGGSSLVDLVSSLNTTRLVSYGFLNEATLTGITAYRYNSLMDVRTTEFCRHLNNRVFPIQNQLERLDTELRINDSQQLKNFAPFPRWDQIDEFKSLSTQELIDRGWAYPPLHFYCRSVIEYVEGEIQVGGLEIPTAREGLQEVLTGEEIRALLNMQGITNTTINLTRGALQAGATALTIIESLGISAETLGLINALLHTGLLD
ncbi:putative head morphogenesis protein [Vibrio phage vB_VneS_J26]